VVRAKEEKWRGEEEARSQEREKRETEEIDFAFVKRQIQVSKFFKKHVCPSHF